MSTGQGLIRKQTCCAAKAETAAGTAVALTAAEGAFINYNGRVTYRAPTTRRQKPGSASNLLAKVQARAADVSVILEMANSGSGTLPLWASTFLPAAGWVASGSVYSLVTGSASADTLTFGEYVDGQLKQAAGVSFDWTMRFSLGMVPTLELTGQGCYVAPTSVALIRPTFPTVNPPTCRGIIATVGGTQYTFPEIVISGGNVIYLREDVSTASGYRAAQITDRDPTVSISPEALALGTKDWYADHIAETEAALSIVVGSGTNGTMTLACPKLQNRDAPKEGERNGVVTNDLILQPNTNGADDDEMTMTFS